MCTSRPLGLSQQNKSIWLKTEETADHLPQTCSPTRNRLRVDRPEAESRMGFGAGVTACERGGYRVSHEQREQD